MVIKIVDTMPGGAEAQEWDAPATRLDLRTIIAGRVRHEVTAFNRDRPEIYHGLVAPEESERLLNGYRQKCFKELDAEREIERACESFEKRGFLVFAGARRIESLDEEIDLSESAELEFFKLVPLAGG